MMSNLSGREHNKAAGTSTCHLLSAETNLQAHAHLVRDKWGQGKGGLPPLLRKCEGINLLL